MELQGEEGNTEGSVDLLHLTRIIEARVSEILDAVKYLIDNSDYGDRIPAGVVITGGTAYLSHLPLLAGAILERKVRLAAPRSSIADDSNEAATDTYSSTAVGLLLEFYEPKLSTTQNVPQKAESPFNGRGGIRFEPREEPVTVSEPAPEPVKEEKPKKDKPVKEKPEKKPEKSGDGSFGKWFGTLFGDNNNGNEV